jgi:hypothetical protein
MIPKAKSHDTNDSKPISRSTMTNTLRMAEPMHRKVPRGASTGQSIRNYSPSCIQQVRDTIVDRYKRIDYF